MKELKEYTKAQLVEAINKATARNPCFMYYIHSALDDMEHEQEKEHLDKADEALQESINLEKQLVALLSPYKGRSLSEIPDNVFKEGAELERKLADANKRYSYHMRKVK